MDNERHITDEALTRYLCGQCTPDEAAAVEAYLGQSDERIDDLLAMVAAVECFAPDGNAATLPLSKTHLNIIPVSLRLTGNLQIDATPRRRLWPALSAAASVAAILLVGAWLWLRPQGLQRDAAPAYAAADTIETLDTIEP